MMMIIAFTFFSLEDQEQTKNNNDDGKIISLFLWFLISFFSLSSFIISTFAACLHDFRMFHDVDDVNFNKNDISRKILPLMKLNRNFSATSKRVLSVLRFAKAAKNKL